MWPSFLARAFGFLFSSAVLVGECIQHCEFIISAVCVFSTCLSVVLSCFSRLWSNFGEIYFALRTSGSFRGGSCEGDGLASTCVVPTCVGKDRLLGVSGRTSVASSFAPTAETQDTRVIAHGA